MVKFAAIEFVEVEQPITEPVTKFGGQPVWLEEPQWPLSKATGDPMQFICQIAIDPALFGRIPAQMAYLFMTAESPYVGETFAPDGGENAVILQPGTAAVPARALSVGPTLYKMMQQPGHDRLSPLPCEFAVRLHWGDDPDFVGERERWQLDEVRTEAYIEPSSDNKLGGTPYFMQGDEFPSDDPWHLLLQLDSTQVPFEVNFGDAGIGYAFLSQDGRVAKFLWQCA